MKKDTSPPTSPPLPIVVRMPKSGQKETYSNLGRTQIDMVTRPQPGNNFDPPVKSHIFAAKGAARGVRLVNLESLLDYVRGLSNTQPKPFKKRGAK